MERKQQLEKLFKDNLPKGVPKATKKILEKAAEKFAEALQNYYELPCALGETVTDISEYFDGTENPQMYSFVAESIAIELDGDEIVYFINNDACYKKEDFGKTVFFGADGLKEAEKAKKQEEEAKPIIDWTIPESAIREVFGDYEIEFTRGGGMRYIRKGRPELW